MLHTIRKKCGGGGERNTYLCPDPIISHQILTPHNLPYLTQWSLFIWWPCLYWEYRSFTLVSLYLPSSVGGGRNSQITPPFTLEAILFIFYILPHSKKGFEENEDIGWHGSVREQLESTFSNSTLFSETMSSPYKDGKITKSHTVKVKDSLLGNKCPQATVFPVHLWA